MRLVVVLTSVAVVSLLVAWAYLENVSDAVGRQSSIAETEGEIWEVVDRAVTSLEYTTAKSKEELERILAKTYAGPVLTELTNSLWQEWPSDNVVQVEVVNRRSIEIYGNDARVEVGVYFWDWADESEWYGTGVFTLACLKQGWRVISFDYEWERRTSDLSPTFT